MNRLTVGTVLVACLSPAACTAAGPTGPTSPSAPAFSTVSDGTRQSTSDPACTRSAAEFVARFTDPAALVASGASKVLLDHFRRALDEIRPTIPADLAPAYDTMAAAYRHVIDELEVVGAPDAARVASIVGPLQAAPVVDAREELQQHFASCLDHLAPR